MRNSGIDCDMLPATTRCLVWIHVDLYSLCCHHRLYPVDISTATQNAIAIERTSLHESPGRHVPTQIILDTESDTDGLAASVGCFFSLCSRSSVSVQLIVSLEIRLGTRLCAHLLQTPVISHQSSFRGSPLDIANVDTTSGIDLNAWRSVI